MSGPGPGRALYVAMGPIGPAHARLPDGPQANHQGDESNAPQSTASSERLFRHRDGPERVGSPSSGAARPGAGRFIGLGGDAGLSPRH
jgi:hypothetical protein